MLHFLLLGKLLTKCHTEMVMLPNSIELVALLYIMTNKPGLVACVAALILGALLGAVPAYLLVKQNAETAVMRA